MAPLIYGHTSIILKTKHGLVERYESDNTFQGSIIAKFVKDSADSPDRNIYQSGSSAIAAPWKAMAGGLLLFRDAITAGSQFMPAGNVMVGKGIADVTNATVPAELGSYNSLESSASGNAITQVWDFSTSQANGDIGCVCLTSREGGMVGYGNKNGAYSENHKSNTLGYLYKPSAQTNSTGALGLMADNGKRYTFSFENGVLTATEYRTCGISSGSVFAGLSTQYTHDLTAETALVTYFGNVLILSNYCGNNIIRLFPEGKTNIAAGDTIYYIEYNCATHTATAKSVTNGYSAAVDLSAGYSYRYQGGFTADNRLIVFTNATPYAPIVLNLDGTVEFDGTAALTAIGATGNRIGTVTIGPDLYIIRISIGSDSKLAIIDTVNDTIRVIDADNVRSIGGGSYSWGTWGTYMSGGYYQCAQYKNSGYQSPIVQLPMYLATINNLETAVTKDASKSMKVIYTLTEV